MIIYGECYFSCSVSFWKLALIGIALPLYRQGSSISLFNLCREGWQWANAGAAAQRAKD